ncbi:DUF3373 domain-containing protein [Geobacter pelophilus]|uniref:DUF3373 domain-containing protein n=1 Tax=Geoanaerobacter pelophilus TaxID=60036 RepID=A0AAW4L0I5_9BACT|nr:DUF3373 domain-containing protein [Geoanaerobacter pelophilus]MBT0664428.1 DUF3373 domain-containing protein [Geoanaerobacter pelophilus]
MNRLGKNLIAATLAAGLVMPVGAMAADDLSLKIDMLQKEVDALKAQTKKHEDKSIEKWLTIGGDYRFRVDSLRGSTKAYTDAQGMFKWMGANALISVAGAPFGLPAGNYPAGQVLSMAANQMSKVTTYSAAAAQAPAFRGMLNNLAAAQAGSGLATPMNFAIPSAKPSNDTLYTNRFGLDLHAKAVKDITVNVRLLAYKTFGSNDDAAVTGNGQTPYFADRVGVFDGTLGHIPSSDYLGVDRAYVTWANILDSGAWFSVGRRPSTNGIPSHLKLNNERPGNGGTPALLVDYAFDGMTIGWAPDIAALPGAYAKVCYGRGFESGLDNRYNTGNSLQDTDMLGIAIIPVDTDPLRIHLQWNRGFNIFDFPTMNNTYFGNTGPAINLGDMDWYGIGLLSTLKKVGPGNLNLFSEFGMSVSHPNQNVSSNAGFQGLMTGSFMNPEAPSSKTGYAVYAGARYDLPSNTKLGFEYNYGTKNWQPFSPAADDMWTAKVGTRGSVFEPYIIQELNLKPISSYFAKAFFKIGYQYYDFEYTGSNNWVGAPVKIDDVQSTDMMLMAPLKNAQNIYGSFEVKF